MLIFLCIEWLRDHSRSLITPVHPSVTGPQIKHQNHKNSLPHTAGQMKNKIIFISCISSILLSLDVGSSPTLTDTHWNQQKFALFHKGSFWASILRRTFFYHNTKKSLFK